MAGRRKLDPEIEAALQSSELFRPVVGDGALSALLDARTCPIRGVNWRERTFAAKLARRAANIAARHGVPRMNETILWLLVVRCSWKQSGDGSQPIIRERKGK